MNSRKEFWNNGPSESVYDLADLTKLNGTDNCGTSVDNGPWVRYVSAFQTAIPFGSSETIFEFGCRTFLIPFYHMGNTTLSIDYSKALINIAKISLARSTCN